MRLAQACGRGPEVLFLTGANSPSDTHLLMGTHGVVVLDASDAGHSSRPLHGLDSVLGQSQKPHKSLRTRAQEASVRCYTLPRRLQLVGHSRDGCSRRRGSLLVQRVYAETNSRNYAAFVVFVTVTGTGCGFTAVTSSSIFADKSCTAIHVWRCSTFCRFARSRMS